LAPHDRRHMPQFATLVSSASQPFEGKASQSA
jgi:hypothetical protein